MKLGIYGGSFNPPHIGHLHVADVAYKAAGLDYIVFIPAGDPYMKPKEDMAPAFDRLKMTQLAIFGETKYFVSNLEMLKEGPSYTSETISSLKTLFPNDELYLIVGQDAMEQMPSWNNVTVILESCKIIVVIRGDKEFVVPAGFDNAISYVINPGVNFNISSTQIRNCIKNNIPIERLVNQNVINYINERKLYK